MLCAGNNHHQGDDHPGDVLNGDVKEESPDITEAEMEEGFYDFFSFSLE